MTLAGPKKVLTFETKSMLPKTMIKVRHGFPGERLVVFPFYLIEEALHNPLTPGLAIHSMGYFPHAEHHFINRPTGTDEYILIYCVQGKGWYTLRDEQHQVNAHQFFILPPHEPHAYGADCDDPWYIYWIHFKGSRAREIAQRMPGLDTIGICPRSRIQDRTAQFDELLNVMEGVPDNDTVNYANLTLNALLASFLFVDVYREAKNPVKPSENISFLSRATHYLNENIENKISVRDMASYMGYSESQFYRLFYEQTGYAPMTYFMHLKVEHACSLLHNTRLQIHQIALKMGYDDPYYFSRFFKKMTGISPQKYRDSARERGDGVSAIPVAQHRELLTEST